MSYPALSSDQIDYIYAHNFPHEESKYYAGCYAKDELRKMKAENRFYILNLDDSSGGGTHWVLLYCVLPHTVYYFDPFGAPPPEDVPHFLKSMFAAEDKIFLFTDDVLQNEHTQLCGYYCIYISKELLQGRTMNDILLHDFTRNSLENDDIIRSNFKSAATIVPKRK